MWNNTLKMLKMKFFKLFKKGAKWKRKEIKTFELLIVPYLFKNVSTNTILDRNVIFLKKNNISLTF